MLAVTYSFLSALIAITVVTFVEFLLFYFMVLVATREHVVDLFRSFYKVVMEALLIVFVLMAALFFLKLRSKEGIEDFVTTVVQFEQVYALALFLALTLLCSIYYPAFAKDKYRYAFFSLVSLLLFLLFYIF